MSEKKKIKSALISVYHKEGLDTLVKQLDSFNVEILSTGGTYEYIQSLGVKAKKVEDLTSYPSILAGRVKTLHPKVFGGILGKHNDPSDKEEMNSLEIPAIDLVVVDLYPFEDTVANTSDEQAIIEKIDIGGISLIRAGAKNFNDVLIVSSMNQYEKVVDLLNHQQGATTLDQRKAFAAEAFAVSSHYDTAIFNYFNSEQGLNTFRHSEKGQFPLRYGENPHQKGMFYGDLEEMFTQLHGKAISYNNLLDLDAAVHLINEFSETTFAILKHNNVCGIASRDTLEQAWKDALAGDPVSAFGGVLVTNRVIDKATATLMNKLFFEIVLAPGFDEDALEILKTKKNRIILKANSLETGKKLFRSVLNGVLEQDRDTKTETIKDFEVVTLSHPAENQQEDLIFANILVKHTKSNAIVLARNKQLLASGVGQTSRVDALKQAIDKALHFEHELKGAVMASDAFFPFSD
ncbi:MAG TPA: bifunctional phosphoribosylaminoimidazolecarboxamide formyltransferase/IMP cyclohydrolase, partial [Bacteroidales bacterium]|nr:bifunctional phosphoribosylaminoimidazolecarboxamide formyltransferase/IMP cyclohydrolase [Bacteroidales bacterium]